MKSKAPQSTIMDSIIMQLVLTYTLYSDHLYKQLFYSIGNVPLLGNCISVYLCGAIVAIC